MNGGTPFGKNSFSMSFLETKRTNDFESTSI